jgi:hypothetical protein
MYAQYKESIDEGSPYDIPYSVYVSVTTSYIKSMIERLYEGIKVRLPFRLGALQIVKKKMYFKTQINKRLGIDWAATNKYGKLIHHTNEHSDKYKFLYSWDRRTSRIKNIQSYRFIPCRTLKRTLAKLIKEHNKDYFEA